MILIAPLDWGLGHTTRCIPLIRFLLSLDCQILVAANVKQEVLLRQEFDQIQFVRLKGYELGYGRSALLTVAKILLQIPKILVAIRRENRWLKSFLLTRTVHAVISDNRYGFYTERSTSIFITHQLAIQTPFGKALGKVLRIMNYLQIRKFHTCWVPDYAGAENLAGALSHPSKLPPVPVHYLGRLTRISLNEASHGATGFLLIILSGPEPQRSIFEKIILRELDNYKDRAVLVRGLPGEQQKLTFDRNYLTVHNYLSAEKLAILIQEAGIIISRSGYSTVMDIAGRGKKCIFIPTPGQTEQEYLAKYLEQKNLCIHFPQSKFSLRQALLKARQFPFAPAGDYSAETYQPVLREFVMKLKQRK